MYVYVMKNKAIPALVKIGCSDNPSTRAQELNTTGVPGRWQVFARFSVVNKREAEAAAHRVLTDFRKDRDREFFRLNPENAAERVAKAVEPWHVEHPRAPDDWSRWSDPAKWLREREEDAARRLEEEAARRREEERQRIVEEQRRRENEAERKKNSEQKYSNLAKYFFIWLASYAGILLFGFILSGITDIPIGDINKVLILSAFIAVVPVLYYI